MKNRFHPETTLLDYSPVKQRAIKRAVAKRAAQVSGDIATSTVHQEAISGEGRREAIKRRVRCLEGKKHRLFGELREQLSRQGGLQ